MKTLFQEDERYTSDAIHLLGEIRKVIKPIIKGYAKNGYSIRELSHIAQATISDFEAEFILTGQVEKQKLNMIKAKKRYGIELGIIPTDPSWVHL